MKMSLAIIISLNLFFSNAYAEYCSQLVGTYKVDVSGCTHTNQGGVYSDGAFYSSINISYNPLENLLIIRNCYHEDEGGCFFTNYIADGKEHVGVPFNTGKTYTASCEQNEVHVKRVGLFRDDLFTTFAVQPSGFILTDSFAAGDFSRTCPMVRVSNER